MCLTSSGSTASAPRRWRWPAPYRRSRGARTGTAVKVLPLEHPLRTAEDAALADILSQGCLDVGVGLSYRQYEFEGLGVPCGEGRPVQRLSRIIIGAHEQEEMIFGGPETWIAKIEKLDREAGVNHLLC